MRTLDMQKDRDPVIVKKAIKEYRDLQQRIKNSRKVCRITFDEIEKEIQSLIQSLPEKDRPKRGRPLGT